MSDNLEDEAIKDKVLEHALQHVPFDGWTKAAFESALEDANLDLETGYRLFPKGEADLPIYFHEYGDKKMLEALAEADLYAMRYSEKIAEAIWLRVTVVESHQILIRKLMATFLLPINMLPGTKLVWGTADKIWTFMDDDSEDYNWYTKRMILSGIISSTFLFFIGDRSEGCIDTREFIHRRINDVMEFEKIKSHAKGNPIFKPLFRTLEKLPIRNTRGGVDKSRYPGWMPNEENN